VTGSKTKNMNISIDSETEVPKLLALGSEINSEEVKISKK